MRYAIPAQTDFNPDLLQVLVKDWLEANPEDTFTSVPADINLTYHLQEYFPSHLSEDYDQVWTGFWDGLLPGDPTEAVEDQAQVITLPVVDGVAVVDQSVLEQIAAEILRLTGDLISGGKGLDPSRSTHDA